MRDINKIIAEIAVYMIEINAEEMTVNAKLRTNQVLKGKLTLTDIDLSNNENSDKEVN